VGAGDSFFAGFVDGWQRARDARAALRGALSVSAARVTSMTHGALRRETIDRADFDHLFLTDSVDEAMEHLARGTGGAAEGGRGSGRPGTDAGRKM